MHVTIFGAGALGTVFGVRLAARTNTTVSFIVRPTRLSSTDPLVIERVKNTRDRREHVEAPTRVAHVPADADVILLAVGTEDLEAIGPLLDASSAPIVVLTPMMPKDYARMRERFGHRVLAAMPTVVAHTRDGVVRYWLPPSPTLVDEPRAGDHGEVVRALARSLDDAGLPVRFDLAVHETNPASTACFIPVGMLVAVAGSLRALSRDPELTDLATRACREGVSLGVRLGRPLPPATFAPMVARTSSLRLIAAALERLSPEIVDYVDAHFGRKLLVQHRAMAREMIELARLKGTPHEALEELAERLERTATAL